MEKKNLYIGLSLVAVAGLAIYFLNKDKSVTKSETKTSGADGCEDEKYSETESETSNVHGGGGHHGGGRHGGGRHGGRGWRGRGWGGWGGWGYGYPVTYPYWDYNLCAYRDNKGNLITYYCNYPY